MKPGRLIRYKSGRFSILVGQNVFTSVLADYWKILTSNRVTSFLDWICPRHNKLGGHDKSATFLSLSAELFDRSSSPTCKKYLPIPNQLHFWTGQVQSIVKVKIKFEVQVATVKQDGGLFF